MPRAMTPEQRSELERRKQAREAQGKPPRGRPRRTSASPPSSGSAESSGSVSTLPPSADARPPMTEAMVERALAALEKLGVTQEKTATETKLLPENPDELEKCLKLARLPARLPVMAVDESARALGARGLSDNEREEGI